MLAPQAFEDVERVPANERECGAVGTGAGEEGLDVGFVVESGDGGREGDSSGGGFTRSGR